MARLLGADQHIAVTGLSTVPLSVLCLVREAANALAAVPA
jgi:hypothetical protein